jgi:hypothetical protein
VPLGLSGLERLRAPTCRLGLDQRVSLWRMGKQNCNFSRAKRVMQLRNGDGGDGKFEIGREGVADPRFEKGGLGWK